MLQFATVLVMSFAFDKLVSLDVKFPSLSFAVWVIAMAVTCCEVGFPRLLHLGLRRLL